MKTKGFTLIELLIVTAIIAILFALLLPALRAAKARATLAVCLGHLKETSHGLQMYLQELSDDTLPPGKYSGQGTAYRHPKIWSELLVEHNYIDNKEGLQCPADDVTDNWAFFYDIPPVDYPDYYASYGWPLSMCDLGWDWNPEPKHALLRYHEDNTEKQVLMGDCEGTYISVAWFGWGPESFKWVYEYQFPFRRHNGVCGYVMLDGHAQGMRVPFAPYTSDEDFESAITAQFDDCSGIGESGGSYEGHGHVCFWNRYGRALRFTTYD